ncbi:MAG: hypothetical protein ACKVX7_20535 [Planctomycetota bacterium]
MTRNLRNPLRQLVLVTGLLGCVTPLTFAAGLTAQEQKFLDYLANRLRYLDTTERYLKLLEKTKRSDSQVTGDIEYWRVTLLRLGGADEKQVVAALETFKKRNPDHPRAKSTTIEVIGVALGEVIESLRTGLAAAKEGDDPVKRAESEFDERILTPLNEQIAALQKQYEREEKAEKEERKDWLKKNPGKKPPQPTGPSPSEITLQALTNAELSRIALLYVFGKELPTEAPRRKKLFETGLAYCEPFVRDRYRYTVMLYRGVQNKGLFLMELGNYATAEEDAFSQLYQVEPDGQNWSENAIFAFKQLRLKGLLYGSRCLIETGQAEKAYENLERYYRTPTKNEMDLAKAEDDSKLRPDAIAVSLEYGIALAGVGRIDEGLAEVHRIIKKPGLPSGLVIDAQRALGRIANLGDIVLSARDYYQAAIGLKSERKFAEATTAFLQALAHLDPKNKKERDDLAPRCLNEIGEIGIITGENARASLAYQQVDLYFRDSGNPVVTRVAQNFLAAVTRAIRDRGADGPGHKGFTLLKTRATKLSDDKATGSASQEILLFDAIELEQQLKFAAARAKYLEVRENLADGTPFEGYLRAQAGAWACAINLYVEADLPQRASLETDMSNAKVELAKVVEAALAKKDMAAATRAADALGYLHNIRGEHSEAVTALAVFRTRITEAQRAEGFRCHGLSTLVLSGIEMGELTQAESDYKLLESICAEDGIVGFTANALMDAFVLKDNPAKGAEFAVIYAKHPSSKSDLAKPEELVQIIAIMIEGGQLAAAQGHIDILKQNKLDEALERKLAYLDGKRLVAEKKYPEAIARFEAYLQKFRKDTENFEDPFVLFELGSCFITKHAPKTPPAADLNSANTYLNQAVAMMGQRRKYDATAERIYWPWMYRFLELRMMLAEAGGGASDYRQVVVLVGEGKKAENEMGGLRDKFLELERRAAEKLKASGKEPKKP